MRPRSLTQRELVFQRNQPKMLQDSNGSTRNPSQNCNISDSLTEKLSHSNLKNLANQTFKIVMGLDTVSICAQPAVVVKTNEFNLKSWNYGREKNVTQTEFDTLKKSEFIYHKTKAIQTKFYGDQRLVVQFNVRKVLGLDISEPINLDDFKSVVKSVIDEHLASIGFYLDDFKYVTFSRIDVCFDLYSNTPSRPIRDLMQMASKYNGAGTESNQPKVFGNTMYSGIKYVGWKVYDKQLESKLDNPCTRIEASVKGKYNQRMFACHKLKDLDNFDISGIIDRYSKDFPMMNEPMDFSLPAYSDMTANEHKLNAELQSVKRMGGKLWSDKVENYLSGLKNVSRSTKSRKRKRLMRFSNLSDLQTEIPAESIRSQLNLSEIKNQLVQAFNQENVQ